MPSTKKNVADMTMAELEVEAARLAKQYTYHSAHNQGLITDKVKILVGGTYMIRYKSAGTVKIRRARKDENLSEIPEAQVTAKAVKATK